jgi:hypothetical protein
MQQYVGHRRRDATAIQSMLAKHGDNAEAVVQHYEKATLVFEGRQFRSRAALAVFLAPKVNCEPGAVLMMLSKFHDDVGAAVGSLCPARSPRHSILEETSASQWRNLRAMFYDEVLNRRLLSRLDPEDFAALTSYLKQELGAVTADFRARCQRDYAATRERLERMVADATP